MKIVIKYFIVLFLAGCANIKAPSGGPPDTTPPEIIAAVPPTNSINFSGNRITVEFSEYVEHSSVTRSINIQPEIKVKYKWAGRKLRMDFQDELNPDVTYSVTFGTDYTDLRKNKPTEAYTIIFTPGDVLDSGTIIGKLFAKNSSDYKIFVYNITNLNPDTLRFSHTKPDYSIPLGSEGTFSVKALKDGIYRLICIKDVQNSGLYNKNSDFLFTASQDFTVEDAKSGFAGFKEPVFFDEIPPQILSAKSISQRIIEINFSEPLDTSTVSPGAFSITDSAGIITHNINFAFLKPGEDKTVQIITNSKLDTLTSYKIEALLDSNIQIADTSGNIINDSLRFANFTPRTLSTEIQPRIQTYPFKDSSNNISTTKNIDFIFSTGINFDSISAELFLIKDSTTVNFEIIEKTDNILSVKIDTLDDNSWYRLILDTRKATAFNGLYVRDSLVRLDFKTIDKRSYGGMNGTVLLGIDNCDNPVIRIINTEKKFTALQNLDENGSFSFEEIPSGNYVFEIFCDSNNNMKIDAGYDFPFEYSEKFFIPENKVSIKSRWTFDNIFIQIDDE